MNLEISDLCRTMMCVLDVFQMIKREFGFKFLSSLSSSSKFKISHKHEEHTVRCVLRVHFQIFGFDSFTHKHELLCFIERTKIWWWKFSNQILSTSDSCAYLFLGFLTFLVKKRSRRKIEFDPRRWSENHACLEITLETDKTHYYRSYTFQQV